MLRDTEGFTDSVKCVIFLTIVSNFGCSCARAMNQIETVLFIRLVRSKKSYQILSFA